MGWGGHCTAMGLCIAEEPRGGQSLTFHQKCHPTCPFSSFQGEFSFITLQLVRGGKGGMFRFMTLKYLWGETSVNRGEEITVLLNKSTLCPGRSLDLQSVCYASSLEQTCWCPLFRRCFWCKNTRIISQHMQKGGAFRLDAGHLVQHLSFV